MTRSERIRDLLAVTARLIACVDQEIELLRAMQPQEIGKLQADKLALTDAYEAHFRALRDGDADGEAVSAELLEELADVTARFQQVVAENARALKAVREVNERVLKAIVEAVERNRAEPAGYTNAGQTPAPRRRAAAAPAMAVNQRL